MSSDDTGLTLMPTVQGFFDIFLGWVMGAPTSNAKHQTGHCRCARVGGGGGG